MGASNSIWLVGGNSLNLDKSAHTYDKNHLLYPTLVT